MTNQQGWRGRQRRFTRRNLLGGAAISAVGAGALVLVGCGDDDDRTTPTPGSTPAAGTPVSGGTARYPLVGTNSGNPPSLYPWENVNYLTQHAASLHYSRLLKGSVGPNIPVIDTGTLEGDLAEALPEQPDATTYVFKIRAGVRFHDKAPLNGREVTARDVAASYAIFAAQSLSAGAWTNIVDRVEATDDRTVRLTLKAPFAPFLVTHASSPEGFWFVPEAIIESGQAKTDPVGTGPFVFRQFESDVAIRWDRNPAWYAAPQPYFAKVETTLSPLPDRIIPALRSGSLDWCHFDAPFYESARDAVSKDGTFVFEASGQLGGFIFNFDIRPFQDICVRQALSMAMDRKGLLGLMDRAGKGDWHAHLPPSLAPFYISPRDSATFGENAKYFAHNPQEARALLRAAGFPDGLDFRITANIDRYGPAFKQLWEAIQSGIRESGFRAELVFQEYGTYIQSSYFGKVSEGVVLGPLTGSPREPDNILMTQYASSSGRKNWSGTPIPEMAALDEMFLKQRTILDREERIEFIRDIQRTMAESMLVVPYVAASPFKYFQPWVQNMYPKNGYSWHAESIPAAWFTQERVAKG
jgi:peptide/nickel transport system substrate-binding protein